MKTFIYLLFLATIMFNTSVKGQTSETKKEITYNDLNLSDDQVASLTKARETIAAEMEAKRETLGKNSDQIKELAVEQQQKMLAKMEEILNEEQLELHKKNITLLKEQQIQQKNNK